MVCGAKASSGGGQFGAKTNTGGGGVGFMVSVEMVVVVVVWCT